MSDNRHYKLNITTIDAFSERDKFHIRDQFDTISMVLNKYNGGEIRPAEYYFRYCYETTDKIFIEDDNEKGWDNLNTRHGRYETIKDGYICYVLGIYVNGEYFESFDIPFVIKQEEKDEFDNELWLKMSEYSLLNDYRFSKIKKIYI